jgi:enediyne biosynthesis protein E11
VTDASDVYSALAADGEEIDRLVADLDPPAWSTPTPATGWTIADQVAHLTATFRMAALAAAEPDGFRAAAARLSDDFDANVRDAMASLRALEPPALLSAWRAQRAATQDALTAVPAGAMVPWLVRPLPAPVLAAAGMMELFGHGQDVADALGVRRTPTDRLRHLVAFAVRTWDFGYLARGLAVPDVALRFEITAPSGELWTYGPADAADRISGSAHALCLLVTRRRHRADVGLKAVGPHADGWLDIAQAYRGPAGPGRSPGQFPFEP